MEARLALALVSAFPAARPFALYRFGVEAGYGRFEHTERPPARWVWRSGSLPQALTAVLMRKTLDEDSDRKNRREDEQARVPVAAAAADVGRWLDGAVDEALLARWIARLALFDWRSIPRAMRELVCRNGSVLDPNGALVLAGLLQPLFDRRPLRARALPAVDDLLSAESGARTPGAARAIASLIRTNQIDAAVGLAASRYAMAGVPLIRTATPWSVAEPDRLLASVLFAIADHERSTLIDRWLRPRRLQGEHAHA
jgi:CRISPR-associated protein Csx17